MKSRRKSIELNAELKTAEGGAWCTGEMMQRGITAEDLVRRRRGFQIAYWKDRFGGYHYPKWQFDRTMRVLPEVGRILMLFRTHDTMRVLTWFVRPVATRSKSLLDLIRAGHGERAVALVRREEETNASVPPLSRGAVAELRRRMKDIEDPMRFVIASVWTRKHVTFYDVGEGVYSLSDITPTCLFRRRAHAETIAKLLDGRKRGGLMRHIVVAVKKTSSRIRLLETLPDPRDSERRFKPRLRTPDAARLPVLVPLAPPNSRAHFVESFLFAVENHEAVIEQIASARSRRDARSRLIRECQLSPQQAEAMLELRLGHFTRTEARRHKRELQALLRAQSEPVISR